MSERFALIARKQEVRQRIEQLRRQLEHKRVQSAQGGNKRVRGLENELERLMAQEYNLRVAIDRSK